MRILSVIIASPLRKISGATNAGRDLSIATAELTDLELAVMWDADERVKMGALDVRHMRCTNRLGPLARFAPRFAKVPLYDSGIPELIRDGRYDLVHIHNLVPTFAAERVAKMCRRMGTPYIISSHGFVELSQFAKISGFGAIKTLLAEIAISRPFKRVVKGAAAIFALSDCEAPLLNDLGVPPEKVHVVTNGVNSYFLDPPSSSELDSVKARLLKGEGPVLLFMGSLHAYKGVDTFLQSLAHIRGPFRAIVAGKLKGEEERLSLLAKSGLPEHIAAGVTFTGAISNEDLRALYHSADLLVYPTRGDTLPLVVLEAMACGRPVISTKIGGLPFAVTPETGVLVQPDNPQAVAAAVAALVADPEKRAAMGRAARRRVETVFVWSQAAREAVRAYERILGKTRAELAPAA